MKVETLINDINRVYPFKLLAFFVLSFPAFQNYIQLQTILLALETPKHTCSMAPPNVTFYNISKDQCSINYNNISIKCNEWNFSMQPVGTTMVSDYGLICDFGSYQDYILIAWYVTSFVGLPLGWLSDKVGRKPMVLVNLLLEIFSCVMIALAPNVGLNILFRILLGISGTAVYISYVWLQEIVDNEFREIAGSFFWFYGCLGYMFFPLVAFYTRNWRHTQLFITIPSILYLSVLLIPESPRWLLVSGRKKKAIKAIKKISQINKIDLDMENINLDEELIETKGSFIQAFESSIFVQRIALGFFFQFSTFLFYSAISVNLKILAYDIFLSVFLSGLMETPGLLVSFFSLRHFKRKLTFLILGLCGSVLFMVNTFLSRTIIWQKILRIVLGCIGKMAIASVNQSAMVFITELLPTSHRSLGNNIIQVSGFMSFVGAIYINKLERLLYFLPILIYNSILAVNMILMYFFLPETKGLPIPATIDDIEMLKPGKEDLYKEYMNENLKNSESDIEISSLVRKSKKA